MTPTIDNGFGYKIREVRQERGLSMSQLARDAGVSKSYLSQIENGNSKQPSATILLKIATALDSTLAHIINVPRPVYGLHIYDEVHESLKEMVDRFGDQLDIAPEDIYMLAQINYRGRTPDTAEGWLHILLAVKAAVNAK